jgi:hypothetical protein
LDQTSKRKRYKELESSVYRVWHRALDNFAMHELRVMLERHPQVLLCRDLGLGSHVREG